MIDTNIPLIGERRWRRLREMQRCLTVAINAETEPVAAFMIDDALRLSAAAWPPRDDKTPSPGMVHADASC